MLPSICTAKKTRYSDVNEMIALGDFGGAVAALGPEWRGPGVTPSRNGYDDRSYAYLMMVCGVLTAEFGLMGNRLLEKSKDMLFKSVRLFGDDLEGAQIALSWLGTAYDRCGDFNEALALADGLLQNKDSSLSVMVCAAKTKSIALDGLGNPQAALDTLSEMANAVSALPALIQGKFYLQRGKVLRKLGRLDEALEDYDLAMECFHSAKSLRYEAVASNNIAGVYIDLNEFTRAHVLTEKAVRLFKSLGDENHEGMAWDQSAQIYRKEGKYHEAERASQTAISLLERGDHSDFLAEAYTTYGTILIEKGMAAIQPLQKAAAIYAQQNNQVQLQAVNSVMWDAVVRIKRLAKDTSSAMYEAVRPIEKLVIEQALERHDWHFTPAAKELGMTHRGMREKLKQRFPDLEKRCQPVIPRKQSIMNKRATK